MRKKGIAIIGTKFIGDYHARAVKNAGGAEITAACAKTAGSAGSFAERYGVSFHTTRFDKVLALDTVDAVVIGTPNRYHHPYAMAALRAGKDVLLEKPMAMTLKQAEEIGRAARRGGRVVLVGHMWRFDTEVNYIRKVVSAGRIGEVVKTKGYGIHENWGPAGWFVKKSLAGGGALADMGVHAIDTVRYIMGDPRPKRVYACIGAYYGKYDVDDTGVIVISWDNGATSIIESGWWQPHMDGPEAGTGLFGTKGYASLFPTELKIKVGGRPGVFRPSMPEKQEHCDQVIYDRQMKHFIDCMNKRKEPSPGIEAGITVMRIVDAAYRSSKSGQAVKI